MRKYLFFVVTLLLLSSALPAFAANTILPSTEECVKNPNLSGCCAVLQSTGAPPLSCALELGVNITNWILGITGSLAILYFVYGGFLFLISGGNEQQISKGKTILTQAAIGIIIIFGAYIAVKFVVSALGASKYFKTEFEIQKPIEGVVPTATPTTTLQNAAGAGGQAQDSGTECLCVCDNGKQSTTLNDTTCTLFCLLNQSTKTSCTPTNN